MASSSSDPHPKSELVSAMAPTSEPAITTDQVFLYRDFKKPKKERGCTAKERISKMPPCTAGKRSSIYRGVTRHRWTGRYEAHLWDKSTWNQNQNKKGKQVYLGAYDDEEAAARAYDLAALKYWGPGTLINFPVSDYTRDLEEMQNFSREEYLASLRRKSSGFSRGISKYRGLSRCGPILKDSTCMRLKTTYPNISYCMRWYKKNSRWEPSYGRMAGSDYFNSIHYGAGDNSAAESEYISGFSVDRKIDLTSYIKWWGSNKSRQADAGTKSSEEKKRSFAGDHSSELRTLEQQPTEPYQMPRLGASHDEKKHKNPSVSALSILSQSAAYKSLLEKATKREENSTEPDENENKNSIIDKLDRGKAVEKSSGGNNERPESVTGMSGGALPLQKNVYNPLAPFLSAPILTAYNNIDPLVDPLLWTSLVPMLPAGFPRNAEVTKTEASSSYTVFQPEE